MGTVTCVFGCWRCLTAASWAVPQAILHVTFALRQRQLQRAVMQPTTFYSEGIPNSGLMTPSLRMFREFGGGLITKKLLGHPRDLECAEAPLFVTKTCHLTSKIACSWQKPAIHDQSRTPAELWLHPQARSI